MIALDTEDTGVDFFHGTKPFLVTTCSDAGEVKVWEWPVDPLTRQPDVDESDLDEIESLVRGADRVVLQNGRFDVQALATVRPSVVEWWPWDRMDDTLVAGHLLASAMPHNLTDMVMQYLGDDIEPAEKELEAATKAARKLVQQARLRVKRGTAEPSEERLAAWQIAEEGRADMPSAKSGGSGDKDKTFKADYWLPRALWERSLRVRREHPGWETILSEYACKDSEYTLALWMVMERELQKRGLWAIYRESMRIPSILYRMKRRGITVHRVRLQEFRDHSRTEAKGLGERCVAIAREVGCDLSLPKSGNNDSLRHFCFDVLKLPIEKRSKDTGAPSLDKEVMAIYETTLNAGTREGDFVRALQGKRKLDTTVQYMDGYERFLCPTKYKNVGILYPDLNQTGTGTLRFSSSCPNGQNIPRRPPEDGGRSIKWIFGPAPGREWWSFDYENIELCIPAYESGEKDLIDLFERKDDPPYYGSEHLLNFSIIYPDIWGGTLRKVGPEKVGATIKKDLADTWYGWCKNGDFACGYGAGENTADRAFHRKGCYRLLKARFAKKEALNAKYIQQAKALGYVTTLPDKTVDPTRGYPIMCSRSSWGDISPTVPLNYHVQSTAMWCTRRAMVRCQDQLDQWRRGQGFDGRMVLQVHDEIVFDLPVGGAVNLCKVAILRKCMEESGRDIDVPLSVAQKYHPNNWGDSEEPSCPNPVAAKPKTKSNALTR